MAASITYCKKDGEYLETVQESVGLGLIARASAGSWSQFLEYCFERQVPYAYCKAFWDAAHPPVDTTYTEPPVGGTISSPVLQFTSIPPSLYEGRVVSIVGPTGCGKTTWALTHAPLPCLLVTHLDQLRRFDQSVHKSIVFDDMSFTHMPRDAQLHLLEQRTPASIHVRYGIVNLPPGIPKIFTSNSAPFLDDPAINRRIHSINLINESCLSSRRV